MPNLKHKSWMNSNVLYIVEDCILGLDIYPDAFSLAKIRINMKKECLVKLELILVALSFQLPYSILWGEWFFLLADTNTYRVLQTIQMKLIPSCAWAEPAVLGSTKTALKFKHEI